MFRQKAQRTNMCNWNLIRFNLNHRWFDLNWLKCLKTHTMPNRSWLTQTRRGASARTDARVNEEILPPLAESPARDYLHKNWISRSEAAMFPGPSQHPVVGQETCSWSACIIETIDAVMTANHYTVSSCRVTCKLQSVLKDLKGRGKKQLWFVCLSQEKPQLQVLWCLRHADSKKSVLRSREEILRLLYWSDSVFYFSSGKVSNVILDFFQFVFWRWCWQSLLGKCIFGSVCFIDRCLSWLQSALVVCCWIVPSLDLARPPPLWPDLDFLP